ncbi:damage-control phosphatase ARMT1 family protein [Pseudodesulfovibrio pelocollis]|uniref:damage-control phosphatase ARMT1 family protein n=1 Tax=Pseudodesulfovibrio pelocollis TaxID=3051432 RepID=UPI00255A75AF|nr:ARMT1-like domain-containing protein [Pseudodesulfovibrio sp. SB368]
MNTATACLECFERMAHREAQLALPYSEAGRRRVVEAWSARLAGLDLRVPPPVIFRHLVETVAGVVVEMGGQPFDHYAEDKRRDNETALRLLPALAARLDAEAARPGGDSLAMALELAIIGNSIDRGVDLDIDWEAELNAVGQSVDPDTLARFSARIVPGARVVVLGDNAGEIALDTLLVRQMLARGCDVTYAVRSCPVINDATLEDAARVGMTELCRVVESGVDTPGTVLDRCSPQFLERLRDADVVLSKGQGNFEALHGAMDGVYCAFKVKCDRVADETGLPLGRSALIRLDWANRLTTAGGARS